MPSPSSSFGTLTTQGVASPGKRLVPANNRHVGQDHSVPPFWMASPGGPGHRLESGRCVLTPRMGIDTSAIRHLVNNCMKISEIARDPGKLRWATGPDVDKAVIRYRQKDPDYVVVDANIRDLFQHTRRDYRLDLDDRRGGSNAIGNRIARAKAHWDSGAHMDPAEISIQTDNRGPAVVWQDGRHRLAAAHQMGHDYGQVVVPRSDLDQLRKMVRIK